MKKFIGTTLAVVLSLGLSSGAVMAQSISNTGPDSTNVISVDNTRDCTVTNNNDVNVSNNNNQGAGTGNANTGNNTTGGNATTGGAANQNDTNTSVNINNGGCAPTSTKSPATPATPATPGVGGSVLGSKTAATSLPETGSAFTTAVVVALAFVAAGLAMIASPFVGSLRRSSLR